MDDLLQILHEFVIDEPRESFSDEAFMALLRLGTLRFGRGTTYFETAEA